MADRRWVVNGMARSALALWLTGCAGGRIVASPSPPSEASGQGVTAVVSVVETRPPLIVTSTPVGPDKSASLATGTVSSSGSPATPAPSPSPISPTNTPAVATATAITATAIAPTAMAPTAIAATAPPAPPPPTPAPPRPAAPAQAETRLAPSARTDTKPAASVESKPVARQTTPSGEYSCPASHPVKGNIGSNGRIYHTPASRSYNQTKPEVCFVSPEAAAAAGFRAPLR